MRVVCHWEIPIEKILAVIEPANIFDDFLSGVLESIRVDSPKTITRVFQIHSLLGLTNRAAFVDYTILSIPEGKKIQKFKAFCPLNILKLSSTPDFGRSPKKKMVLKSFLNPLIFQEATLRAFSYNGYRG